MGNIYLPIHTATTVSVECNLGQYRSQRSQNFKEQCRKIRQFATDKVHEGGNFV